MGLKQILDIALAPYDRCKKSIKKKWCDKKKLLLDNLDKIFSMTLIQII